MIDFRKRKFPFYKQLDSHDCGPACLKMILRYYGKIIQLEKIKESMNLARNGVSLHAISSAAGKYALESFACEIRFSDIHHAKLPAILHWNEEHFVVLYKIRNGIFYVADPAFGLVTYKKADFIKSWCNGSEQGSGIALLLQPEPGFENVADDVEHKASVINFALPYISKYRTLIIQFLLGIVLGGIILYSIPLLTRAIVDLGIAIKSVRLIYLILIGQLFLYLSSALIEFIRRWIIVHLSAKISITILSDFLKKLMRLPLRFFDSKLVGDILQRIDDHERIQAFISSSSLNFLISIVVFIAFSVILVLLNVSIFAVFIVLSALYIFYVLIFLKKRSELDFKRFNNLSQNRSSLIEMIQGMPEIKLSNSERVRREGWNKVQEKLFQLDVESNKLSQAQDLGSRMINDFKNIIITAVTAKAVVDGSFTLGEMLTVQFIIGQLNVPLNDFLIFVRAFQDTKISLKRIMDVHQITDEQTLDEKKTQSFNTFSDIVIKKLSFSYDDDADSAVLKDLSLTIPNGKITAIVGSSGSGKTTLMKILLKYYEVPNQSIFLEGYDFNDIHSQAWRLKCGAVLQDGYLFTESIAHNVALSESSPDLARVNTMLSMVNLSEFVDSLPQKLNTKIGKGGLELSVGQKQRILIARALYKEPEYLFLDEATSSLDARNEKIISDNLFSSFYNDKTVLIIAHRLSTVKNAHKIAVMDEGKIVEEGTHSELLQLKGKYHELINNQLEQSPDGR